MIANPVTVAAVRIVDQFRSVIATLTPSGWIDPWGVAFAPEDQRALTACASQSDGMRLVVRGEERRGPKVYVTL